jgi:hypothetical protein
MCVTASDDEVAYENSARLLTVNWDFCKIRSSDQPDIDGDLHYTACGTLFRWMRLRLCLCDSNHVTAGRCYSGESTLRPGRYRIMCLESFHCSDTTISCPKKVELLHGNVSIERADSMKGRRRLRYVSGKPSRILFHTAVRLVLVPNIYCYCCH